MGLKELGVETARSCVIRPGSSRDLMVVNVHSSPYHNDAVTGGSSHQS